MKLNDLLFCIATEHMDPVRVKQFLFTKSNVMKTFKLSNAEEYQKAIMLSEKDLFFLHEDTKDKKKEGLDPV